MNLPAPADRPRRPAPRAWQRALAEAVRDPDELCRLLDLEALAPAARIAARGFPIRIPRGYIARMRPGDPRDPLLRQVLPVADETDATAGFVHDPLEEVGPAAAPGLLAKYPGRVLLVTTGACAVHCRYCFRRHYPYADGPRGPAGFDEALAGIAADPGIHEVILSGGDPLSWVDERLAELAERLAAVPHLRRLRVHSRWPVVIPERVDDALLEWLTGTRLTAVMVIHANHARELDDAVAGAVRRLTTSGVTVLNQAVLLAGVNDELEAQVELAERLSEIGVVPYYLHQLDRVAGAAHFEVPEARGLAIVRAMRDRLPGYLVPRYVREIPGASSKTPIT